MVVEGILRKSNAPGSHWQKCAPHFSLAEAILIRSNTDSLDELTDMVVPLFSPILNRQRDSLPMFSEHPFGPEESGVRRATLVSLHSSAYN
jgi:hypothetical protein